MEGMVADSGINELSLLLEEEVDGYKIKGWTLRQWVALYPLLQQVCRQLQDAGCTWDGFADFLAANPMVLADAATAVIVPFLSQSLGISEEEAGELPLPLAVKLAIRILAKNIEHLKLFFSQIRTGLMNNTLS